MKKKKKKAKAQLREPKECVLCGICGDRETEGPILQVKKDQTHFYYVHENCLNYSSRITNDEDATSLINRIISWRTECNYELCKRKRRGSVCCIVPQCTTVYHFGCAKKAEAELCPNLQGTKMYCKMHQGLATKIKKLHTGWPGDLTSIHYITRNDWREIPISLYKSIQVNEDKWERYVPDWFHTDLEPRIKVRQIFPGHWAWCDELQNKNVADDPILPLPHFDPSEINENCNDEIFDTMYHGSRCQFEAVAIEDIAPDEFICEYVGRIKFHRDCPNSRYIAAFWKPESVNWEDALCVDAESYGNEARYINSVTPTTPPYFKQNATMSTVWCRGELRVIISATRFIPKLHPIIIDYDEFENSYFDPTLNHSEEHTTKQGLPVVYISVRDQGPPEVKDEESTKKKEEKKIMLSFKQSD